MIRFCTRVVVLARTTWLSVEGGGHLFLALLLEYVVIANSNIEQYMNLALTFLSFRNLCVMVNNE